MMMQGGALSGESSGMSEPTPNTGSAAPVTPMSISMASATASVINHSAMMPAPVNGAGHSLLTSATGAGQGSNTITVLASGSQHVGHTPTKTIVVVPVSTPGSGDGPNAKKLKTL